MEVLPVMYVQVRHSLTVQVGQEVVLQNCCLPYAVICESCHLCCSRDRNHLTWEQFKAQRTSEHVTVRLPCIPLGKGFVALEVWTDVIVHVHMVWKCLSKHSLSLWKGYCTMLSRSMRPWVIICLACVSHASLTRPVLLIFHLSIWASLCSDVWEVVLQRCLCWVPCLRTFSHQTQMTAPDFK